MWYQKVETLGEIKLMKTREGNRITHASIMNELWMNRMLQARMCERKVKTKGNER